MGGRDEMGDVGDRGRGRSCRMCLTGRAEGGYRAIKGTTPLSAFGERHVENRIKATIESLGAEKEEVLEVILRMSVYAGFPTTLFGLAVYEEALKELGA